MEPQQARWTLAGFITLCAIIVFNALFLQKDRGLVERQNVSSWRRPVSSAIEARSGEKGEAARKTVLLRAIRRELLVQNYFPARLGHGLQATTIGAIMAYEHDHHLPITGRPSDALLKALLFASPSLAAAQGGRDMDRMPAYGHRLIAEIKGTLSALGLYHGRIDGRFGSDARRAVRAFEAQRGLPVTGRISGLLVQELERVSASAFRSVQLF